MRISEENAPASLNSDGVRTQYILWGVGREWGEGRGRVERSMYSRPLGGGNMSEDCMFWRKRGERRGEGEEAGRKKEEGVRGRERRKKRE